MSDTPKYEPIGFAWKMKDKPEYGSKMAVVGWATFDRELQKLKDDTWVIDGIAEIAPLYSADALESLQRELTEANAKVVALEKDVGAKQAEIDRLMLEFCPEEMTQQQLEQWGKRQKRVSPEREAELRVIIDRALGIGQQPGEQTNG